MSPEHIIELMEEINDEALIMDNFNAAIIGIVERFGMQPIFLYDWQKCVDILTDGDAMSREEAEEYLDFNCIGAWMGDGTPAFANRSGEMESLAQSGNSTVRKFNSQTDYPICPN